MKVKLTMSSNIDDVPSIVAGKLKETSDVLKRSSEMLDVVHSLLVDDEQALNFVHSSIDNLRARLADCDTTLSESVTVLSGLLDFRTQSLTQPVPDADELTPPSTITEREE